MESFAGSATQLIADVDCTAAGKPLCDNAGVKGYPTLKWGDPSDLQDYQGDGTWIRSKSSPKRISNPCAVLKISTCATMRRRPISRNSKICPRRNSRQLLGWKR